MRTIESKITWWVWDILHRPMAQGWNSFYTQQDLRICASTRSVMAVRLVNGRECWDLGGGGDSLGEKLFVGKKKLRLELSERGSRGSEDAYSYAVPWCRIRTSSLIKYFDWIRSYNDFAKFRIRFRSVDVFHFVVCCEAQMIALGRLSQLQKAYDLFKARFLILWNEEWIF